MEELMDLLVKDESPSQVSDKIKDMLFAKTAEKIDAIRPKVAASVFDEPSLEIEDEVERMNGSRRGLVQPVPEVGQGILPPLHALLDLRLDRFNGGGRPVLGTRVDAAVGFHQHDGHHDIAQHVLAGILLVGAVGQAGQQHTRLERFEARPPFPQRGR